LVDGLSCPELARGTVAGAGFRAADSVEQPSEPAASIDLAFARLNLHHRQGELQIRVPDGETLEVEVVCIALACGHPALRIELGARASLRLFERHLGVTGALANLALSVQLGHGARLEHARLLQPADSARHFETLEAVVGADAHYRMIQVTSGAAATRSTALVALEGAGADLGWHTAVLGAGTQTHDAYVRVTHDAPAVRTEQGFRGIAADRSRIAFNGHMRVTARAPGAHSAQTLRGLTAGAAAEIDLRPQLEIDIDDVRAAYIRAMTPKPVPVVSIEHIHSVRVSVGEAVEELIDELPRFGRVSFRRLTETLVERLEIVVRFLAVLELFKQGFIELDQPSAFGDIEIIWVGSPAIGVADLADIDNYDG
jgi:hypothetical protein